MEKKRKEAERKSLKEMRDFIRGALHNARNDFKSLTRTKTVSAYQQLSEAEKVAVAFDDIVGSLILPPCPVCGDVLHWRLKEDGGGIGCNKCENKFYTTSYKNPIGLRTLSASM